MFLHQVSPLPFLSLFSLFPSLFSSLPPYHSFYPPFRQRVLTRERFKSEQKIAEEDGLIGSQERADTEE